MQRAGRFTLLVISALAILWIAGAVNQYLNNVTYNKCRIADQKFKYDTPNIVTGKQIGRAHV